MTGSFPKSWAKALLLPSQTLRRAAARTCGIAEFCQE
jgi:hypothetical protein